MGIKIRSATPADAAGIAAVWAAAMPQLVKTAKGIEAELRTSTSRVVLIAVDGEEVVGYGNVYLPSPDDEAPRVLSRCRPLSAVAASAARLPMRSSGLPRRRARGNS